MHATIEVSPGELIDKLTILDIKLEKINDEDKLKNVRHEKGILMTRFLDLRESLEGNRVSVRMDPLIKQLYDVNEKIWDIEDGIRDCERNKDFSERFIELARGVYQNNDERSRLKRATDTICGSELIEEKSYQPY